MILNDTFTDADNTAIQNHTAELGGVWLERNAAYAASIVAGAAGMTTQGSSLNYPNSLKYNAAIMPVADYTVEAEYQIQNAALITYYQLGIVARHDGTNALVGSIDHTRVGDSLQPYLGVRPWESGAGAEAIAPLTNGVHRLTLNVVGNAASLRYDDLLIREYTIAASPLPGPGTVGFLIGNTGTSAARDVTLLSFTVNGIAAPAAFWTNLYGQYEST